MTKKRIHISAEVSDRTVPQPRRFAIKDQPVIVWVLIGFMIGAMLVLALGKLP